MDFRAHLDGAWGIRLTRDVSEARTSHGSVWHGEGRFVENVKGLSAQFERQILMNRNVLDQRCIVTEGDRPARQRRRTGHISDVGIVKAAQTRRG